MVNKNSGTPLYRQIVNELRKEIFSNQYGKDGCLGTHLQLAERFGVSLITIRKAVQLLEEEGIVEIHQGKGTFVRNAAIIDPLRELIGASNIMSELNVKTENEVPILEIQDTPFWLPRDVRTILGPRCLFVMRVISLHGTPVSCAEMYLPIEFAGYIQEKDVEQYTIYQIFENKIGLVLGKGRQIISATGAKGRVAEFLKLPDNWPVLQIERKAYDDEENLIEYMILSYEASRYSFSVELKLNSGSN